MRILLDECVPWPLAKILQGHDCTSPQRREWGGIKNGYLLKLAEAEFDLFITSDQNLRYQQNLAGRTIAILELSTNDWHSIQAGSSSIIAAIEKNQPLRLRSPDNRIGLVCARQDFKEIVRRPSISI